MNNILKTNSFAILLILILLGLNTYVLIQYVSVNKELKQLKNPAAESVGVSATVVLTEFLDVVLNTRKTTPDDRIKLESDIRQLGDKNITAEWEAFLVSKDAKISQAKVIKIIGMLEDKMSAR